VVRPADKHCFDRLEDTLTQLVGKSISETPKEGCQSFGQYAVFCTVTQRMRVCWTYLFINQSDSRTLGLPSAGCLGTLGPVVPETAVLEMPARTPRVTLDRSRRTEILADANQGVFRAD